MIKEVLSSKWQSAQKLVDLSDDEAVNRKANEVALKWGTAREWSLAGASAANKRGKVEDFDPYRLHSLDQAGVWGKDGDENVAVGTGAAAEFHDDENDNGNLKIMPKFKMATTDFQGILKAQNNICVYIEPHILCHPPSKHLVVEKFDLFNQIHVLQPQIRASVAGNKLDNPGMNALIFYVTVILSSIVRMKLAWVSRV